LTALESFNTGTDFFDHSGEFVPEQSGGHDHARMIAALVHLQVGAAGKGYRHLHQNFAISHPRNWYPFNLYVLFAIEDGGCHLSVHYLSFHELPGCITSFIVFGWGWAALLSPSIACPNGK